jgi:Holliday junction DNA helicase RuvB
MKFNLFSKLVHKDTPEDKLNKVFPNIYERDDIKPILFQVAESIPGKPNAALLYGPPGTAKTDFVRKLVQYYGNKAHYGIGSSSTKAGVFDYCFEHPDIRLLIIDELDKMPVKDQASLLNLMETGELRDMKSRKQRAVNMRVNLVCTANDIDKIIDPLKTRFEPNIFYMRDYTNEEWLRIAQKILIAEEGIKEDIAEIIALRTLELSDTDTRPNIRAVVKVARQIGNDLSKLDPYLQTIRKYQK